MSYSIVIIVIKLKSCLKFIMNNDKSSLESPNILIFHYSNQIHYRLEINKIKSKWTWPIESWLYPLFWYSNSIEMKLEQLIFFFFISLNSARICRYFQLNLLVPRCSIGINCYSFPPQRKEYSKSQHKSHFQHLSLIPEQDQFISI